MGNQERCNRGNFRYDGGESMEKDHLLETNLYFVEMLESMAE